MQITKRETVIILTDEEKKTFSDASNIIYEMAHDMGLKDTVYGHYDHEWANIADFFSDSSDSGEIRIKEEIKEN